MKRKYKIFVNGELQEKEKPTKYIAYKPRKIFGLYYYGIEEKISEKNWSNWIFFRGLEDAVKAGYRPCNKCHPINEKEFQRIKNLIPNHYVKNLIDFYNLR